MKIGVFILVLTATLYSCSPMRKFQGVEMILFGSGGGFTGEFSLNAIERSGAVRANGKVILQLDEKQTSKLFSNTQKLKTDTINDPGNIYNYIEFNENGIKYRFTWNPSKPPSAELSKWYNDLNSFIKKEVE